MLTLINQITALFANESINTLQNSDLQYNFGGEQAFDNIFDAFVNDTPAANFAALGGQELPASSYTPLSFHINQTTLSAQFADASPQIQASASLNARQAPFGQLASSNASQTLVNQPSINQPSINQPSLAVTNTNVSHPSLNASAHALVSKLNATGEQLTAEKALQPEVSPVRSLHLNNLQSPVAGNLASHQEVIPALNASKAVIANNPLTHNEGISQAALSTNNKGRVETQVLPASRPVSVPHDTQLSAERVNALTSEQNNVEGYDFDKTNILSRPAINKEADELSGKQNIRTQTGLVPDARLVANEPVNQQQLATNYQQDKIDERTIHNPQLNNELKRNASPAGDERNIVTSRGAEDFAVRERDSISRQLVSSGENQQDLPLTNERKLDGLSDIKSLANNTAAAEKPLAALAVNDLSLTSAKSTALDKPLLPQATPTDVKNTNEIAQQITWARSSNANHIKIALTPEHLGALEINIEQDADGLHVQFTTQNALAKEAIETFMPRLKEMLDQQGLNLQHANVEQQDSQQHAQEYDQLPEQGKNGYDNNDVAMTAPDTQAIDEKSSQQYLLEAFA